MDSSKSPETSEADDRAGKLESHGIEFIPEGDRHGHPRELFPLWLTANINVLYLVFGGLMILFGLNLWQAVLAVLLGNLAYLVLGFMATAGPRAGTSTLMITRAQYGVRGNQVSAFFACRKLAAA